MPTTFDVIYLGVQSILDPTEGNTTAENASALVGRTFGSANAPLATSVQSLSAVDTSAGNADSYETDANNGVDTFSINGGAAQNMDAVVVYNATITYSDGTTAVITAVIMQDDQGRTYLVPEITANEDQAALESKSITSLTLDSVNTAGGLLGADRDFADFDTELVVNGTAGDDTMRQGYVDADGDQVDSRANTISAGAGNDTINASGGNDYVDAGIGADSVYGGLGDDTILGGDGNDTLSGGTGTDSISGGAGNDLIKGGAGKDTLSGGEGNDTIYGGSDTVQEGIGATDTVSNTFSAFNLGTFADIDPTESNGASENAANLLGTYGSAASPLYKQIVTVRTSDTNANGRVDDNDNGTAPETININGQNYVLDSTQVYNATVIFTDGTTGTFTAVVSQTTSGETIMMPEFSNNADNTLLTSKPIQSFTFNSVSVNDTGLTASRFDSDFQVPAEDGAGDSIDGGAGDDLIFGGAGNDTVSGGTGQDTVTAGGGDDSVDGGADNDRLNGGGGNDTITGGAGNDTIDGGLGDDLLTGGDGDDTFTVAPDQGQDTITDFNFGNSGALGDGSNANNDFIDLSGYYDGLQEIRGDFADDGVLNQSNTLDSIGRPVDYSDNLQFGTGSITFLNATPESFRTDNTNVVCFTSGTMIMTPNGEVPIDSLQIGDLVTTLDNGPQPLRWIGRTHLNKQQLNASPNLRPVLIREGVMGATCDLLVSPQHGLLDGRCGDVLLRATHLVKDQWQGIRVANGRREVTYMHLLFDAHQIILAQGVASESLYPGPMAMRAMASDAETELLTLFPELAAIASPEDARTHYGDTAREFCKPFKMSIRNQYLAA